MNGPRTYIGLAIFVVIAAAVPVGDRFINGPAGEAHHQQLLAEWHALKPIPDAVIVKSTDSFSGWRPRQSLVGATYRTSATGEVVRHHYDRELLADGWQYEGACNIKDWGKDLGGAALTYRKSTMHATLQFAGKDAQYGWTFAFDLSWGLRSTCS